MAHPDRFISHNIWTSYSTKTGLLTLTCKTCNEDIFVTSGASATMSMTDKAIHDHIDYKNKENSMGKKLTLDERLERETIRQKKAEILLLKNQALANDLERDTIQSELRQAEEDLAAYLEDLGR